MNRLPRTAYRLALWALALLGTAAPAAAAEPSDGALRFGVLPRMNFTETVKMFTPLADHLSRALGREVRLEATRDFEGFWDAVASGRYDLVFCNQYQYLKARKLFGYEVIARNEESGKSTIAGAIVVRKDSGITRLAQLRGRKIVFGGGRDAMQAYIVATHLLRRAGLGPGDYIEEFPLNPPNAALAVYHGQADAGGVGDAALGLPVVRARVDVSQLVLIARSEPLPHLPWMVKGRLDPALKARLQAILVQLKETDTGRKILARAGATGIVLSVDADFDPARRIVHAVTGERY